MKRNPVLGILAGSGQCHITAAHDIRILRLCAFPLIMLAFDNSNLEMASVKIHYSKAETDPGPPFSKLPVSPTASNG